MNLIISNTDIDVSCTIGNLANNAPVVPLTRGIAGVHRIRQVSTHEIPIIVKIRDKYLSIV